MMGDLMDFRYAIFVRETVGLFHRSPQEKDMTKEASPTRL